MKRLKKVGRWIKDGGLVTIFLWILAVGNVVAAFLLLSQEKPQATVILGLLIWSGICVVLAAGGINLIRRIQRIGPGGVEFETWQDIERILSIAYPPLPKKSFTYADGPWVPTSFTPQQSWFYERATSIILHLQHRGIDPEILSKRNLDRYRRLILWVGIAALNVNYTKALETLQLLERIEPKDFEELYYLGYAYLSEAQIEKDPQKKKSHLQMASRHFGEASRKDDKDPDVFWNLGWIYDELGRYGESIKANQKAIEIDPGYIPWAFWTMAVSYLKQNDTESSLKMLNSIPKGKWWDEIYNDDELKDLRENSKFCDLYKERKSR